MTQKGFAPLLILIFAAALGLTAYFSYKSYLGQAKKPGLITASPVPTASPDTDYQKYSNSKFKYSLYYPDGVKAGISNVIAGEFSAAKGDETEITFMDADETELDNFLQIQTVQIGSLGKTLPLLVNEKYDQTKAHFQTTKISDLKNAVFSGFPAYEFDFEGGALFTASWDGTVKVGKYKNIFFEKEGVIYSFYLKDAKIFNEILASFKFDEIGELKTYSDSAGRFTFTYPANWRVLSAVPQEFKYNDYSARPDWKEYFNSGEGRDYWLKGKMFIADCRGPVLQNSQDKKQLIAIEIVSAENDGAWCWSSGAFLKDNKWQVADLYMFPISPDNSGEKVKVDWVGDYFKYKNIDQNADWLVAGALVNIGTYELKGEAVFDQITTSFKLK